MGFASVTSFQFRNLQNETLTFDGKTILFVGENGQGKTNILEMLYLLCYGSSFRTKSDGRMVTHGCKDMSVIGHLTGPEGEQRKVRVVLKGGKKSIFLDDKKIQDRAELLTLAPCIVFSHEDLEFVNGPPENQRTFFNQTVSVCEPAFIETLRTYRRVVKMRNAALAEGRTDLLDIYDTQMIPCGLEIMARRKEAAAEFNQILTPLYRDISGLKKDVTLAYRPSWPADAAAEDIPAFLKERHGNDLERGITTSGPHRDRFRVSLGKADFRTTASTGQMRLLSLVYRVVQALRYVERTGKTPILLLDDVLLELDTTKRSRFLQHIPAYEQAFFTFLPDEQFGRYTFEDKRVYTVSEGRARIA